MSNPIRISYLIRAITLVVGLFTISASVFEYRIQDRIEEEFTQKVNKEDRDSNSQNENNNPFYLLDYQATLSSFQLHMEQVPEVLDHIPVLLFIRKWYHRNFSITKLNFFKTLFQHIISPNAP